MELSQEVLKQFVPKHDFFIGIDSDGSVFDTMELKQKECFIPQIIKHWKLQAISKYARETAEFVNLYSKWRGANRFPALLEIFDVLKARPEVIQRNFKIPEVPELREYVNSGVAVGNPTLRQAVQKTQNPVLTQALEWSLAANAAIKDMVVSIPPFPFVREILEKIQPVADAIVVSTTPCEALQREWSENEIDQYVEIISGQEMGNKIVQLELITKGNYAPNHTLMIGDAPGDFQAAKANNVLFYPINPGHEEESWQRFHDEALDKFLNLEYAGDYEARCVAEYEKLFRNTRP